MTPLAILAAVLLAFWVWILLRRARVEGYASEWAYAPLVTAIVCALMALGLWLR
jgi:hypothetical protein